MLRAVQQRRESSEDEDLSGFGSAVSSPRLALHHLFFAIQQMVIGGELDLVNMHVFQRWCFRQLQ